MPTSCVHSGRSQANGPARVKGAGPATRRRSCAAKARSITREVSPAITGRSHRNARQTRRSAAPRAMRSRPTAAGRQRSGPKYHRQSGSRRVRPRHGTALRVAIEAILGGGRLVPSRAVSWPKRGAQRIEDAARKVPARRSEAEGTPARCNANPDAVAAGRKYHLTDSRLIQLLHCTTSAFCRNG